MDGQVLTHSRKSGHYKPTAGQHQQFISEMDDRGLDLSGTLEEGF